MRQWLITLSLRGTSGESGILILDVCSVGMVTMVVFFRRLVGEIMQRGHVDCILGLPEPKSSGGAPCRFLTSSAEYSSVKRLTGWLQRRLRHEPVQVLAEGGQARWASSSGLTKGQVPRYQEHPRKPV